VIVSAGLASGFVAKLSKACSDCDRYELRGHTATPEELLDAIEAAGRSRPVMILMAGDWIMQEGLELLIEIQRLTQTAMVVLVGADLESLAIGHALRLGLRGLADPEMSAERLIQMLEVIAIGELWINRQLLLEVVGLLAPLEFDAQMDVWLNLPALTQREHEVLKQGNCQPTQHQRPNRQDPPAARLSQAGGPSPGRPAQGVFREPIGRLSNSWCGFRWRPGAASRSTRMRSSTCGRSRELMLGGALHTRASHAGQRLSIGPLVAAGRN